MMRHTRKLIQFTLVLLFISGAFTALGCGSKTDVPAPDKPKPVEESKKSEEINANWTINVNDKITVDSKGLPIKYTLVFAATKNGGTGLTGTYKGTATLTEEADFSKLPGLPNNVIKVGGGINGKMTDSKVNFNMGWTSPADNKDGELAPLVPSDDDPNVVFTGSGTFNFSGDASLNVQADAIGGEKGRYYDEAKGKAGLGFKIEINGATAKITIPSIGTFKGTATGEPIK